MALGLDKLACNLDDDQYKNLREFYKTDEVFKLMRRKGVYPYEYMDSWETKHERYKWECAVISDCGHVSM